MKCFLAPLVIALAVATGCRDEPEFSTPGYGLPVTELVMEPENAAKLIATIQTDVPVPVDFYADGKKYKTHVSHTGKSSRLTSKKSFAFRFLPPRKFQHHHYYRLSAQSTDSSTLRSAVGYEVFKALGVLTPAVNPTTAYLNGNLLGLYWLVEPVDEDYFSLRDLRPIQVYKARYGRLAQASFSLESLPNLKTGFKVEKGSESYSDLTKLIDAIHKVPSSANQEAIAKLLNVDNYLRYAAVAAFLHHWDGFMNNFYLYREAGDPRLAFVAWDIDKIFHAASPADLDHTLWHHNALSERLFLYEDYRTTYRNYLNDLLSEFPYAQMEALVENNAAAVAEAFAHDRYLTGSHQDLADAKAELLNNIKNWLAGLTNALAATP